MTPFVRILLFANIGVFFLQNTTDFITGAMIFVPRLIVVRPWTIITYMFLHAGLMHLAFNMLALVMFGAPLEYAWGERRFATYYLVCVAGAGLCQLGVGSWAMANGADPYPTISPCTDGSAAL